MGSVAALAFKAVNGAVFVVLFALIAEMLSPKRFAGLLSAAPSVALANLTVIVVAKGHPEAAADTRGMLVGSGALVFACLVGAPFVRRWGARRVSVLMCATWLAAACVGYWLVFAS